MENSNCDYTLSYAAHMPNILTFSSSLVVLKFSVHNCFETRVLKETFDAEFRYKLSTLPTCQDGGKNRENSL